MTGGEFKEMWWKGKSWEVANLWNFFLWPEYCNYVSHYMGFFQSEVLATKKGI